MKTVAIVVTYNRKTLLCECLDALLGQTVPVDKIIVINNASTDGTEQLFSDDGRFCAPSIVCKTMESNLGGAGGFSEGVRIAAEEDFDRVWIMDDDTIPQKDALEKLQVSEKCIDGSFSFIASSVFGTEGEVMNVPLIYTATAANGYPEWYRFLKDGLVRIKAATFVSIYVKMDAIRKVGVPFKEYFLWGDDIEFTRRLTKYYGPAYMAGQSIVIHKRFNAAALSVEKEENADRIKNYFYYFRNNLINAATYDGKKTAAVRVLKILGKSFIILINPKIKYRFKKFCAVQKGVWCFVFKRYDYKKFKNRIGNFEG